MGQVAEVLQRVRRFGLQLRQHLARPVLVATDQGARQPKLHGERHELLLSPVVEVPLELLCAFVLGRHDPSAGFPQLLDQANVSKHEPGLRCEVAHQRFLRRVHRLGCRHHDREGAQQLALVSHLGGVLARREHRDLAVRQDDRRPSRVGGPPRRRSQLVPQVQPDASLCRAGPGRQDLRHARQHVIGRVGAGQVLRELGEDLVRRRSLAVHDAVRESA